LLIWIHASKVNALPSALNLPEGKPYLWTGSDPVLAPRFWVQPLFQDLDLVCPAIGNSPSCDKIDPNFSLHLHQKAVITRCGKCGSATLPASTWTLQDRNFFHLNSFKESRLFDSRAITFSLDGAHTFKNILVTLRLSQHKNEICRHLYAAVVPCIEQRQVLASNFGVIHSSPVVFKPIVIICSIRAITAKVSVSTCDGSSPSKWWKKTPFHQVLAFCQSMFSGQ